MQQSNKIAETIQGRGKQYSIKLATNVVSVPSIGTIKWNKTCSKGIFPNVLGTHSDTFTSNKPMKTRITVKTEIIRLLFIYHSSF
mgnify:CR=1 FL=1